MKKEFCLAAVFCAGVVLWLAPGATAQTEIRPGDPRVSFESLRCPESAVGGEIFQADISFRLTAPLKNRQKVFFHLVKPGDKRSSLNADFYPRTPTYEWIVGQIVSAGPISLSIPRDLPPGDYEIRAGLMELVREEDRIRFIREPYLNAGITDFMVGKIAIQAPEDAPGEADVPAEIDFGDFQDAGATIFWEPFNATLAPAWGRLMVTLHPGVEYPAISLYNIFKLEPLFADWTRYNALELAFGLSSDASPANLFIRVIDRRGRSFQERLTLTGGEVVLEFDTLRMSGMLNIAQIEEVKIFAYRPDSDVRFYISRCRLIAREIPEEVAVVTFVRLESPNRVRRGEFFRLRPVFLLHQPIYPDHKLFVHLYRQHDLAGRVGTDVPLSPAIRLWPLNTEVGVDSSPLMISPSAPSGEYIVRTGLYTVAMPTGEPYIKLAEWEDYDGEKIIPHVQQPLTPLDYIKQPYTNTEIKEWEVGRITVE